MFWRTTTSLALHNRLMLLLLLCTHYSMETIITGIVRFRNQKAVQQAMMKFRTAEIVVQDVAVQVKVLRAQDFTTFSA